MVIRKEPVHLAVKRYHLATNTFQQGLCDHATHTIPAIHHHFQWTGHYHVVNDVLLIVIEYVELFAST